VGLRCLQSQQRLLESVAVLVGLSVSDQPLANLKAGTEDNVQDSHHLAVSTVLAKAIPAGLVPYGLGSMLLDHVIFISRQILTGATSAATRC
jgi:hypothetical protein